MPHVFLWRDVESGMVTIETRLIFSFIYKTPVNRNGQKKDEKK